jgi:DNA-binding Lrp family transcriptional regulator
MDKIDVILCQLLLMNSRRSYRELANTLKLSVNSVHKRIQALRESGIIRAFTAKISILALNAQVIWIFGRSEAHSFADIRDRLAANDHINWAAIAGGNYLYVMAHLQKISELEALVDFVRREASLPSPTVGVESFPYQTPDLTLHPLDFQIVHALRNDSRRAVSDIAEELGVSAKTVHRRLSKMIESGMIQLSLEWYPDVSNDILTICHLFLKPSVNKADVISLLYSKYSPNVIWIVNFSNLPDQLILTTWANTMKGFKEIKENLEKEGLFENIVPNILFTGQIFDTWRDKLLAERGAPPNRGSC